MNTKAIGLSSLFVLCYSSGFVATKIGAPYADPMSFLAIRFSITAGILGLLCLWFRPPMPERAIDYLHNMIAGVLMLGLFSAGVYLSVASDTSSATSALIISLQPILASLLAYLLFGAAVSRGQWMGLGIGLLGIIAIVAAKLSINSLYGIMMSVMGLLGVAVGSVYHKYFCPKMSILSGSLIQVTAAAALCMISCWLYPSTYITLVWQFYFALLWMAIIVSIGAMCCWYLLLRDHEISRVSTLFYLMPVGALLISLAFTNESLTPIEIIGILLVSLSVYLVVKLDSKN